MINATHSYLFKFLLFFSCPSRWRLHVRVAKVATPVLLRFSHTPPGPSRETKEKKRKKEKTPTAMDEYGTRFVITVPPEESFLGLERH